MIAHPFRWSHEFGRLDPEEFAARCHQVVDQRLPTKLGGDEIARRDVRRRETHNRAVYGNPGDVVVAARIEHDRVVNRAWRQHSPHLALDQTATLGGLANLFADRYLVP